MLSIGVKIANHLPSMVGVSQGLLSCFILIQQCWHMLISHMSEDDENQFLYPPCLGGLVQKGLRKIPNHPDMVLRVLSGLQDFQGPKMAKTAILR